MLTVELLSCDHTKVVLKLLDMSFDKVVVETHLLE